MKCRKNDEDREIIFPLTWLFELIWDSVKDTVKRWF